MCKAGAGASERSRKEEQIHENFGLEPHSCVSCTHKYTHTYMRTHQHYYICQRTLLQLSDLYLSCSEREGGSRKKETEGEREREREKERKREKENREKKREKEVFIYLHRTFERSIESERKKPRNKAGEREREKERERERERKKESERERKERERERLKERDREKERERDREIERAMEKHTQKEDMRMRDKEIRILEYVRNRRTREPENEEKSLTCPIRGRNVCFVIFQFITTSMSERVSLPI